MSDTDVFAAVREAVASTIEETGFDPVTSTGFASETPQPEVSDETIRDEKGQFTKEEPEPAKEEPESTKEEPEPVKEVKPAKELKEDFRVTAEELDIIDKDPQLKKVYRSMLRGFNKKMEETSGVRKEAEHALELVEQIRANPREAAKVILASVKEEALPEPEKAVVTETALTKVRETLKAKVGEEAADVLAPVIFDVVGSLLGEEIAPIKQTLATQEKIAAAQTLRANISNFGAQVIEDGGEWDEDIEKEMSVLITSGEVAPGRDEKGNLKVDLPRFLGRLYSIVQSDRQKKHTTSEKVLRLREAVTVAEPTRTVRSKAPAPKSIEPGMDIREATRVAVAAAQREAAGL